MTCFTQQTMEHAVRRRGWFQTHVLISRMSPAVGAILQYHVFHILTKSSYARTVARQFVTHLGVRSGSALVLQSLEGSLMHRFFRNFFWVNILMCCIFPVHFPFYHSYPTLSDSPLTVLVLGCVVWAMVVFFWLFCCLVVEWLWCLIQHIWHFFSLLLI